MEQPTEPLKKKTKKSCKKPSTTPEFVDEDGSLGELGNVSSRQGNDTPEKTKAKKETCENAVDRYMPPEDGPIPNQTYDVLVAEWVLGQKTIDVRDLGVWENARQLVINKYNFDMPAMEWRWRWMHYIDRDLKNMFGLKIPDNLPVIDIDEPDVVKLDKAAARFIKLQEVYEKFATPLSISVYSSDGTNVDEAKNWLVHTNVGKSLFRDGEEFRIPISNKLFEGVVFFLPKSTSALREADRLALEMLILLFGGICTPRESDLDSKMIMLATGDPHENLLRLKIWYQVKIYDPEMVRDCIKNGQKINEDVLLKFTWWGPWRRSNFPDAFT